MSDSAAYFNYLGVQDIYNRGVALGNYLKAQDRRPVGPQRPLGAAGRPRFATAVTSFNPFAGKDDPNQYDAMNTAMTNILNTLAGEDPKIYLRTTQWHDLHTDTGR